MEIKIDIPERLINSMRTCEGLKKEELIELEELTFKAICKANENKLRGKGVL